MFRSILTSLRSLLPSRPGYSQYGEDRILEAFLPQNNGKYVDIGSGRPKRHSNTYLFYRKGWSGVCVDANPINGRLHRLLRPRDRVITAFCSSSEGASREFYVTHPWQYSSGDNERINWILENGVKVKKVINVPTTSIERLNLDGQLGEPSFLSIDVEGFEIEVLKGINWSLFKPTAICIESLGYVGTDPIHQLLTKHGYEQVANAVISRIFVLKSYGAFPRL